MRLGLDHTSVGISLRVIGRIRTPFIEATGTPIRDDTPLLDIKPYVPEFDSHPSSKSGWFDASGTDRQVADGRFHEADRTRGGHP